MPVREHFNRGATGRRVKRAVKPRGAWAVGAVAAVLVTVVPTPPAGAAPTRMTAADFLAACTSGFYVVTQNTVVTGRTSIAGNSCEARVAQGVVLTFRDFTLAVMPGFKPEPTSADAFFSVLGADNARIEVQQSRVVLRNEIQFGAGSSQGGTVHVVNSVLRTSTGGVTLTAAPAGNLGEVVANDSTLAGPAGVFLGASCEDTSCTFLPAPSSGGKAIARRNSVPEGSLTVWTGANGRTVATDNTVRSRQLFLHTGNGGSCVSAGNIPNAPCTPPPPPGTPDN